MPCAFDYKYYDGLDLLDLIEDGFYDDYDPYDNLKIQKEFGILGYQECLDSLVDLGAGDFELVAPITPYTQGLIDIDGQYSIGNFGTGMQNAGTGCNGCSGCNVKMDKSKIRDTVKKGVDKNDPHYNRRYQQWNGVGCSGCAAVVYVGTPWMYSDWGYGNYSNYYMF